MAEQLPERIAAVGFELADWQRDAVEAWEKGDDAGPHRGTLEIVTGGGKTLIALACAERASTIAPGLRLAVVVPTEALARQWQDVLASRTTLQESEIGLLGAGGSADLRRHRAVVAVINSAAKHLPEMARMSADPLMLIVDECHRAGAPSFSRVLATPAAFTLGLSATPDREEFDEDGEPLAYDEQLVGRAIGAVVHRFSLRDARTLGWLPDYQIHHHGVELVPDERLAYERLSRRVDDAADRLRDLGEGSGRVRHLTSREGELGEAAQAYVAATSARKDLLYRAVERGRIARRIVEDTLAARPDSRILLFHERVQEAEELHAQLGANADVGLEHSGLAAGRRVAALEDFRTGVAPVLVSVKSLIEGIDVPAADIGISVASSSSVRQRVQSLGRVLRRTFDEGAQKKKAEMHLLYVADSVDEVIYSKQDWSDLTGEGANRYWRWSLDPDEGPVELDHPPATPKPTEDAAWEQLGRDAPESPVPWEGVVLGQEYSVDTLGNVTNASGSLIANPQGVAGMVHKVRGREGGRFRVTPEHRLVLVWPAHGEETGPLLAGRLGEPFAIAEEPEPDEGAADVDAGDLSPGDTYPGPATREGGSYKLRQKRGGVIERKTRDRGAEFALTEGSGDEARQENAKRLLRAWHSTLDRGLTFHVNSLGHAWYTEGGARKFLADVADGFIWPSDEEDEEAGRS